MKPDEENEKEPSVRVVDRRWWARGPDAAQEEPDTRKVSVVEELEQRLADATSQLQVYVAEHRRSIEEFEQVKVRLRRDAAKEVERSRRQVLTELLDVVDNLDRAASAGVVQAGATRPASGGVDDNAEAVENFVQGVRLVRDQFLAKLEAFRVVREPALGAPFDATRHEAVSLSRVATPDQDGIVIAVIRDGYAIGDELLRAASVVVGRYGED
jgi:molecular chaperone GrpE